jgi:hypothetical protein
MAKYVDKDTFVNYCLARGFYPHLVERALEDMPAADAVEVVRCKDCVHGVKREDLGGRYMCRRVYHYNRPEFYCAYGERREK